MIAALRKRLLSRRLAGPRLLRAFARAYPQAFFIEIGANDGVQGDHLHELIISTRWSGVMVEPLPGPFERLRRNYAGIDRVRLERAAVAGHDGSLALYEVGRLEGAGGEWQDWYDSLASFNREAILLQAAQIADLERRLVRTEVACLSFESLCAKHDVDTIDLLAIDTEGYDWAIIGRIDLAAWAPRVLVYEHALLAAEKRAECRAYVEAAGYSTLEEGLDTWCLDTRPDDRLTRTWGRLRPAVPGHSLDLG